jgi:hypothetical protein
VHIFSPKKNLFFDGIPFVVVISKRRRERMEGPQNFIVVVLAERFQLHCTAQTMA